MSTEGVIGLSYYPPEYDQIKAEGFRRTIFDGVLRQHQHFGSMEIDYDIPAFELADDLYRDAQHPTSGVYRPCFMDFFEVPEGKLPLGATPEEKIVDIRELFSIDANLGNGHHIKLRKDIEGRLPTAIRSDRMGIERVRAADPAWLGWTSTNLVVSKDPAGEEVKSIEELLSFVKRVDPVLEMDADDFTRRR